MVRPALPPQGDPRKEMIMPLVRIALVAGTAPAHRQAIADGVHQALVESLQVPADDRFQIIAEQAPENLIFDRHYLGIRRTDGLVFIQVYLRQGRSVEMKQDFYRRVAENLSHDPGLDAGDIFITLSENQLADWSFGQGRAQYVDNPPRALAAHKPSATAVAPSDSGAALAGAAKVLTGGLAMLALLLLMHLVAPTQIEAGLAAELPSDDPVALAGFSA
jgi:phenylpyruvate tautomerase PptA (4-oxalocrotonate tautomerase family)